MVPNPFFNVICKAEAFVVTQKVGSLLSSTQFFMFCGMWVPPPHPMVLRDYSCWALEINFCARDGQSAM